MKFRAGFTLIEFLVVMGILVILASIFVPYLLKIREENNRIACRANLGAIGAALRIYAQENGGFLPRSTYDPTKPMAVFSSEPNDVTAGLALITPILQRKDVSPGADNFRDGKVFICPSSAGVSTGGMVTANSLTYSYASPYGATEAYRLTDTMRSGFVLMADQNPGTAASVKRHDPPRDWARGNTPFHRRAGQNVLYSEGTVLWQITPYCGMNFDNIYTSRGVAPAATQPTSAPSTIPATIPAVDAGEFNLRALPHAEDDSFLLPAKN
jgi:prepilin-type N-terminal cleavage/methylation domain-containing protein